MNKETIILDKKKLLKRLDKAVRQSEKHLSKFYTAESGTIEEFKAIKKATTYQAMAIWGATVSQDKDTIKRVAELGGEVGHTWKELERLYGPEDEQTEEATEVKTEEKEEKKKEEKEKKGGKSKKVVPFGAG